MEESRYIVQTTYNFQTELITINNLSVDNYLKKCGEKFIINFGCNHDIKLYNQKNAEISKDEFGFMVETYWRSASFCINLVANPKKSDDAVIIPKDLQMFLLQRNCGTILEKGKEKNKPLSEDDRKTLINQLHAYLSLKCKNVEKKHMIQGAKTLVYLVPALTDSTEGEHAGFSITFNFICKRFRNQKHQNKTKGQQPAKSNSNRQSRRSDRVSMSQQVQSKSVEVQDGKNETISASTKPTDINDDLKFLKTVVVSEKTTETIKLKLSSTANHRKDMVKINTLDFLEHFPIFYTNPEFVSYDFVIQFPNADGNGFINNWPMYGRDIKMMLTDVYKTTISTEWTSDVEKILSLLKILPAKAGRKSPVVPFINVIDKLIGHSEESMLTQKELDRNIYPRIIACGPTKQNITHYFVVIENHLVFVPTDWNFHQVFDLFFKIHMIFNIKFEYNIAPAMSFIGHYLYNLKNVEFNPALRARNIHLFIFHSKQMVVTNFATSCEFIFETQSNSKSI